MADLVLYWWFHKEKDRGPDHNAGPHRSAESARKAARFWCSREGSSGSEYVILGTPITFVETGDVLDGRAVPNG